MKMNSGRCAVWVMVMVLILPALSFGAVSFTILHTNDFHGNLEASGSNPGAARVARKIVDIRTAVGAEHLLLLDAGDIMQGSLLSNLEQGLPTIDYYRTIGYDAATLGNHEFDWGQAVLNARIAQAEAPAAGDESPVRMVVANITNKDGGGNCTWDVFNASVTPYEIFTVGAAPDTVRVGVIGVGSIETPFITTPAATAGLCFRDPFETISHYYAEVRAASDVLVVLSHNGFNDGGYGYGFDVYGDKTLASRLNAAGMPVDLIIGGHTHTDLTTATVIGNTTVVQAHYNGRKIGRADITYDPDTGATTIVWTRIVVGTGDAEDAAILALVNGYVTDPAYQALINQPIGYVQTDLLRDYNGDSMMGSFINDSLYSALNQDGEPLNDVDMFFNNAGGLRIDWCDKEDPPGTFVWSSNAVDCSDGVWAHDPMLLNYGHLFSILPFGNTVVVGDMTGAQILELLNQSATLAMGAIQPSGIRHGFYRYSDALPGPQPYAWGAFDVCVMNKGSGTCDPLEMTKTYRVGTNEFLAPAGQDGFIPFKYMTNISYWGDMLDWVNGWVSANCTFVSPYRGPNGDGTLDGRIARDGSDVGGSIIPLTILHHNDSHGNLTKGAYVGYTQLATLINQERAHNPLRTLLLSAGDNIQGDEMMFYFRTAPLGYGADGTVLTPPLTTHPLIAAFNPMGYDAMTVGNHEFDFGKEVFKSVLNQAAFPILQANISDDGSYGLSEVPIDPYVLKTVGPEGIKLAIIGIGNHRVPNYQLPTNIAGLTFNDPFVSAQDLANTLRPTNDALIALTHIGFTENPQSMEVDTRVDTSMAASVSGLDVIVGGYTHTNPATGSGDYKFLPTIVGGPANTPVIINQAYRYNNTLGELIIGLRAKTGGYEVISRAGRYIQVTMGTPEDAATKAIVDPYLDALNSYNSKAAGQTIVPIDGLLAFTQETNAANLQADASVWKLEQEGVAADFHLAGAMAGRRIADSAAPGTPYSLHVSDFLTLMPYENSLLVISMNGPQIKTILERAYRNYYYYKYVPGYGGYSYYTTCMLDINSTGRIMYRDTYPALPDGNNVVGLSINGQPVDFTDSSTFYNVSTINYLAMGSCNYSYGGVSLWPLDQIVAGTQYYTREAVIEYTQAMVTISPEIEERLMFQDTSVPSVTVNSPEPKEYNYWETINIDVLAGDTGSGVKEVRPELDGITLPGGQPIDCNTLRSGEHTLIVHVLDWYGNETTQTIIFSVSDRPYIPVPTLSEWGTLIAFLLIMATGILRIRRRAREFY